MKTKNITTVGELLEFSKEKGLNKKVSTNVEEIMREAEKELWE